MTLIEISIALAIAGVMVAIAVPAINSITRAQLRQRAGQLAGGLRAMYGATALLGKSCRLAIDLDAGAYQSECAQRAVTLSKEGERSRNGEREKTQEEELLENAKGREGLSDEDKTKLELAQKNAFTAYKEIPPTQLGSSVKFSSVWVQHQPEPYNKGIAYVYFWPSGLTEAASIQLEQGDDVMTLLVSPLTGRVRVITGAADAPEQKQ
ncbi:MAG: hypothetical protein JST92_18290 [Deltaproteobacteria bacterium]|nr:hypothetical protein [Deltaproteobacteria bacterium]